MNKQDYINANFVLLYSKTSAKIITAIFILVLIATIIMVVGMPNADVSQLIFPAIMLLAFPLLTYFNAKRNFSTNSRVSETIEYRFDNEYLVIQGESFNSQLSWDKIYKVTLTKNWLLIWQNRQIANPVPRRDVWEGDITNLKEILNKHKVKNNL